MLKIKFFGIIAIVAVMGLFITGCDNGNGGDGGTTYAVIVTNGTGSGNYAQRATVTIIVNTPPTGQQFKNWTTESAGVTFANANNASTTFTMPGNAVTVTANFETLNFVYDAGAANIGRIGPGGGKIFYYSAAGFTMEGYGNPGDTGYFAAYNTHYLEAAPTDTGISEWGAYAYPISGVTTFSSYSDPLTSKLGNGRKDTAFIVAFLATKGETNRAAQICAALTTGGKNDWFLPSLGELTELYKQRTLIGINVTNGGYWESGSSYWSSSQVGGGNAYIQYFGDSIFRDMVLPKYYELSVRAVRAF